MEWPTQSLFLLPHQAAAKVMSPGRHQSAAFAKLCLLAGIKAPPLQSYVSWQASKRRLCKVWKLCHAIDGRDIPEGKMP
jgi:hypothetical protein